MAMVRLACDSHASIIVQFTDFYRISIISEILDKVRKQNNTLKIMSMREDNSIQVSPVLIFILQEKSENVE